MPFVIQKSFHRIGKWTLNKAADLEVFIKSCKDVLLKGKERITDGILVKPSTAFSGAAPKQSFYRGWNLHNFQSTLKGNVSKVSMQVNARNNTSSNSFFRNSILWRQARKGHLIAFAGLFLFQEENQDAMKKWQHQYGLFESVCQSIHHIFPSYESKSNLPSTCQTLDDFQLGDVVHGVGNTVFYEAQPFPDEDDITVCSSFATESFDNDGCSWVTVDQKVDAPVKDFLVKAILPENGMQKVATVIKNNKDELLCMGENLSANEPKTSHRSKEKILPPHPNIMKIERAFCSHFPPKTDPGNDHSYGLSSNSLLDQALYIVVKKYKYTLRSYVEERTFDRQHSTLLIAQLLEAVTHLERHNVAHRDVTEDNIWIEFDPDGFPRIVLGGFEKAYCAASLKDMRVPFQHSSLDTRVDHLSSQAPEVANAVPGRFRKVDYAKSDAWMAGCVAYKLLTGRNPFRDPDNSDRVLDSRTYKETDLPNLNNADVPDVVKIVVEMLLTCDPRKRLSAAEAADILHLELFATPPRNVPYDDVKCMEVRNWLSAHCAEALARNRDGSVPFELCQSFFHRLKSERFSREFLFWALARHAKGFYGGQLPLA